jgi:acyl-CoA thioester hydrolase
MPPPFRTSLPIRITDINYGQHVGNDSVVGLLHEARIQFLASLGFSEMDCGGMGLILRRLEVRFHRQLRYGENLQAEVEVVAPGGASFSLQYRLLVAQQLAVEATTEMGFFDYTAGKVARMPALARAKLVAE